jgi:hypothetical protein
MDDIYEGFHKILHILILITHHWNLVLKMHNSPGLKFYTKYYAMFEVYI